ncbi:MAG TPA: DinB family protein [Trebonia sp.]
MRQDPDPVTSSERDSLGQYLDYQRETVLLKTDGLTQEQLARKIPSSGLTLAGLLYHLALVEESWFEERFLGHEPRADWRGVNWEADPDYEFRTAPDKDPEWLRQRYRDACDRARKVAADTGSLDAVSAVPLSDGRPFSLRWTMLHLIEETARHAGHADLLREAIDGTTGE